MVADRQGAVTHPPRKQNFENFGKRIENSL